MASGRKFSVDPLSAHVGGIVQVGGCERWSPQRACCLYGTMTSFVLDSISLLLVGEHQIIILLRYIHENLFLWVSTGGYQPFRPITAISTQVFHSRMKS